MEAEEKGSALKNSDVELSQPLGDNEAQESPLGGKKGVDLPPVTEEIAAARRLGRLFWGIFTGTVLLNYDSGAVPAVLPIIKERFEMTPLELGLLGGLQYIGLVFMSPIAGHLLQSHSAKRVLSISLALNTLFVAIMGFAPGKLVLLATRLGIGISQTSLLVFAPCWVDLFAPDSSRCVWMSLLQAAVPLGIMLGYAVAGTIGAIGADWQISLLVQAIALAPFAVGLFFVPVALIDGEDHGEGEAAKKAKAEESDQPSHGRRMSTAQQIARRDSLFQYTLEGGNRSGAELLPVTKQLRIITRSSVFVLLTGALSSLCFVVTGIQFWITEYMLAVIRGNYGTVLIAFSAVSATAPTLGVVIGGNVIDRLGGYMLVTF